MITKRKKPFEVNESKKPIDPGIFDNSKAARHNPPTKTRKGKLPYAINESSGVIDPGIFDNSKAKRHRP